MLQQGLAENGHLGPKHQEHRLEEAMGAIPTRARPSARPALSGELGGSAPDLIAVGAGDATIRTQQDAVGHPLDAGRYAW
jgi:hypothetical protein